ncbi:MAG: aminotransferase class I/II-fold pyridoxal phosphate-dependent enzyme, partial [Firmicutes bacterium]|nr:aminotransferase class I/II-fold pyridoxal phosphate-dependent enzyme [Bacillota bacterium]
MIEKNLIEWGNSGNLIRDIALEAASRAAEKGAENVYNFTIGAPSIAPPPIIQETVDRLVATVPAVQLHTYAPAPGLPSTLRKIAAYLSETFGVDYTAKDIYMTHGSMSAIAIMCRALMSEGDEAVTLTPYFGEYRVFVEAVGAKMVEAPSRAADLQLDEAAFEAAITPRTAVVMLNSPNNPSGVVLNDESICRASDILERKEMEYGHPIYIIAD